MTWPVCVRTSWGLVLMKADVQWDEFIISSVHFCILVLYLQTEETASVSGIHPGQAFSFQWISYNHFWVPLYSVTLVLRDSFCILYEHNEVFEGNLSFKNFQLNRQICGTDEVLIKLLNEWPYSIVRSSCVNYSGVFLQQWNSINVAVTFLCYMRCMSDVTS